MYYGWLCNWCSTVFLQEACGFKTTAERTQVFKLEPAQHGQVCLSGTGEMPLAAFFMNRHFEHTDLPQK